MGVGNKKRNKDRGTRGWRAGRRIRREGAGARAAHRRALFLVAQRGRLLCVCMSELLAHLQFAEFFWWRRGKEESGGRAGKKEAGARKMQGRCRTVQEGAGRCRTVQEGAGADIVQSLWCDRLPRRYLLITQCGTDGAPLPALHTPSSLHRRHQRPRQRHRKKKKSAAQEIKCRGSGDHKMHDFSWTPNPLDQGAGVLLPTPVHATNRMHWRPPRNTKLENAIPPSRPTPCWRGRSFPLDCSNAPSQRLAVAPCVCVCV